MSTSRRRRRTRARPRPQTSPSHSSPPSSPPLQPHLLSFHDGRRGFTRRPRAGEGELWDRHGRANAWRAASAAASVAEHVVVPRVARLVAAPVVRRLIFRVVARAAAAARASCVCRRGCASRRLPPTAAAPAAAVLVGGSRSSEAVRDGAQQRDEGDGGPHLQSLSSAERYGVLAFPHRTRSAHAPKKTARSVACVTSAGFCSATQRTFHPECKCTNIKYAIFQ